MRVFNLSGFGHSVPQQTAKTLHTRQTELFLKFESKRRNSTVSVLSTPMRTFGHRAYRSGAASAYRDSAHFPMHVQLAVL